MGFDGDRYTVFKTSAPSWTQLAATSGKFKDLLSSKCSSKESVTANTFAAVEEYMAAVKEAAKDKEAGQVSHR